MTLTTEQYRALIEAIAVASTVDALAALRAVVRREQGFEPRRLRRDADRAPAGAVDAAEQPDGVKCLRSQ